MAALPYMQLYVADYLADTMHLNVEEHGAYLMLLMNYWQTGKPLRDDDVRLQCVCKANAEQWERIRPALEEFFTIEGGVWVHERIENDLARVRKKSESARKSAERKHKKNSKNNDSLRSQSEGTSTRARSNTDTEPDTYTDKDLNGGAKRATQVPKNFEPNETCRKKAASLAVDIDAELEKFVNHAQSKGRTAKDWQAAFRNWLIKSAEYGNGKSDNKPEDLWQDAI